MPILMEKSKGGFERRIFSYGSILTVIFNINQGVVSMDDIKIRHLTMEEAKELGIDNWNTWECEPSTFEWYYDESETFYVLDGYVVVITSTERIHIEKNMLVTFPKGLECTWEVRKPIKKAYTFNFES